jgi:acetoin utilization protein AcuC
MLAEMGHKVAYIDIDAHHGDGTQALAYGRSDILTISIHETGQTLYPGTGFPGDSGEGDGVGYSVNIPLSPASTDCHFSWVFDELVTPILSAFAPTAVVLQVGADAHYADPLAHLALTTAGYEDMIRRVMALNLPTVVLGGGGYNLWAVPREYALCQGILAGVELPDDVPATIPGEWGIKYIRDRATPEIDAENMKDIWHYAHTTAKALKEMVFPIHGLS